MSRGIPNLAMSVHQRLMNRIRREQLDPTRTFTLYALERLLFRLSQSRHANRFVLKGAMLFSVWEIHVLRPTRDLDFLGLGDFSSEALRRMLHDICGTAVEPDGMVYDVDSMIIEDIRAEDDYAGRRVLMTSHLGNARIPIQIDIGVGDAVEIPFRQERFPTLLDSPAPEVLAYTRETVIAEKFQAMVNLGIRNSRMKDFFDIWTLARQCPFDGETLQRAIKATFHRRNTQLSSIPPLALTAEFSEAPGKQAQWAAFLRRIGVNQDESLARIVGDIADFLCPVTTAIAENQPFNRHWPQGGPWQNRKTRAMPGHR